MGFSLAKVILNKNPQFSMVSFLFSQKTLQVNQFPMQPFKGSTLSHVLTLTWIVGLWLPGVSFKNGENYRSTWIVETIQLLVFIFTVTILVKLQSIHGQLQSSHNKTNKVSTLSVPMSRKAGAGRMKLTHAPH